LEIGSQTPIESAEVFYFMKPLHKVIASKGVSKKRSMMLANNKQRAIKRKIRAYLKLHNVSTDRPYHMLKNRELLSAFLNQIGINLDGELWDTVYDLYESGEHEFLKAIYVRNIPVNGWLKLRKKVFEIHGEVCLRCGSTENIAVDHIKPYSLYPHLAMDINNLQPLCRSCNSKKSNRNEMDYRKITISE
jgi:hypothetical protein